MKALKITALTASVCAAGLLQTTYPAQAEEFTDVQKTELQALFKEFIMSNPQVVLESVDKYRMSQEQEIEENAKENLEKYVTYFSETDGLPMAGNPEGDVTVVEFFDYNCGYCRKAFEDIQKIIETDKNVRVIFQEMPILSPSSQTMAQMSLAALNQGKYFEMHAALMDYRGSQSEEAFLKLAEDTGLDIEKLKADMNDESLITSIKKMGDIGRNIGIRGTPGFIVGDQLYPGYIGLEGMKSAIEQARSGGKEE